MAQIPYIAQRLFHARQQISGLGLILVVIENKAGFTVNIVHQPVYEDLQALFGGELHGDYQLKVTKPGRISAKASR